jgi:hypothetical protein
MIAFNFIAISFLILGSLHVILSIVSKIILKLNGYKISYLVTQFFYETKILKRICRKHKLLYPVLIAYYAVSILLLSEAICVLVAFFIRVPY